MDESLLHYVWKLQRFDRRDLKTCDGVQLHMVHPGIHSADAGPDFVGARMRIGGIDWTGNVEIHIDSRDWFSHGHHLDAGYNNVILHVVWHHKGRETRRADGTEIPVFELKGRLEVPLLQRYQQLAADSNDIPCSSMLPAVEDVTRCAMIDQAVARRLERKARVVAQALKRVNNNWEEATYRLMAHNFGFKTNAAPFAQLARVLPLSVLKKHADNGVQLEALLFGAAGFLRGDIADAFHAALTREYETYSVKYGIRESALERHTWKFSRMRPAGFPTVRIAQFAAFIAHTPNLFSTLMSTKDPGAVKALFRLQPSQYWKQHYDFGKEAAHTVPGLGTEAVENIIINTLVPVMAAYGLHTGEQDKMDQAMALLASIKAENNRITRRWASLGLSICNASDSQGLIELYNEYCARRKCTACKIGSQIINGD